MGQELKQEMRRKEMKEEMKKETGASNKKHYNMSKI